MSPENQRINADAELRRADQALREAEALVAVALYNGAASRAYYAVYHAACAMLGRLGMQPRTHRGVEHLLGTKLVEPGHLDREHLTRFSRLQERRNVADYRAAEDVSVEQVGALLADAHAFVDAARALIVAQPET